VLPESLFRAVIERRFNENIKYPTDKNNHDEAGYKPGKQDQVTKNARISAFLKSEHVADNGK